MANCYNQIINYSVNWIYRNCSGYTIYAMTHQRDFPINFTGTSVKTDL